MTNTLRGEPSDHISSTLGLEPCRPTMIIISRHGGQLEIDRERNMNYLVNMEDFFFVNLKWLCTCSLMLNL